jgi:hypothetical protein
LTRWTQGDVISTSASGPGCIIQSTYGLPFNPGNFEVVVQEDNNLVHYYRDNSQQPYQWHRTDVISSRATGPGCIIQSTFRSPDNPNAPGNFEVVVLEGKNLVHYWRDNSKDSQPWNNQAVISSQATGPGTIIQSNYKMPGVLEVVVSEGPNVVHYYRDPLSSKWIKDAVISYNAI